jgi:hypothetical protein
MNVMLATLMLMWQSVERFMQGIGQSIRRSWCQCGVSDDTGNLPIFLVLRIAEYTLWIFLFPTRNRINGSGQIFRSGSVYFITTEIRNFAKIISSVLDLLLCTNHKMFTLICREFLFSFLRSISTSICLPYITFRTISMPTAGCSY